MVEDLLTNDDLAVLSALLLGHAAAHERPLEALYIFLEDVLDLARARFATTPQQSVDWSEQEQKWLLSRAADLLERDLQRYPRHRYRVDLYLDRPDSDSDLLETLTIAAPSEDSAGSAALALSSYVLAYCVRKEEP